MGVITGILSAAWIRLVVILSGLWSLIVLIGRALGVLLSGKGTAGLGPALGSPTGLRYGAAVFRAFLPVLSIKRIFVKSYENTGTVLLTRAADVREIIERESEFEVVYSTRMKMITDGDNFFLGMQDTPRYTRDVSNMRLAIRREDIPGRVVPLVAAKAQACVDKATPAGRIDVPQELSLPVATALVTDYFGLSGPAEGTLIRWASDMFAYLFKDLADTPSVTQAATAAAAACRSFLDDLIRTRKAAGGGGDDVLGRCLALQGAGMPGMTDLDIRNNLIGMFIGAIPTTSEAACRAMNQLLEIPGALDAAVAAAKADDDDRLRDVVLEALRFDPINPILFRRAVETTRICRGTWHERTVEKGRMVLVSNLSAMFDPMAVAQPNAFIPGRPPMDYILWGAGLHTCFGGHMNRVSIPGLLKPLLKKPGLRRAPGKLGCIDDAGTPFPVHFVLEFDKA